MMNKLTIAPYSSLQNTENGIQTNAKMFAVSALGHIVFLLVLIFSPSQLLSQKRYIPSAISVSIVSLPPLAAPPAMGGGAVANPIEPLVQQEVPEVSDLKVKEPKPAPVQIPASEKKPEKKMAPPNKSSITVASAVERKPPPPTISISPRKKKVKISLKKKTLRSSRIIKRAIKRIEKESVNKRPKTVVDAIERLRQEIKEPKVAKAPKQYSGSAIGTTERGTGFPGNRGFPGRKILEQIDLYKLEIAYHIEKRWAFSEQLTGGRKDLEAILVIKIMPNGEIKDIWFEKKSGNNYFDDSAYKAIKKSNPLPPLPRGYIRPFYNVGLVFTPSGLRRGTG
ncbi:MAG: TonB C-terminal domain-containing protein [Deltaproteobacteria bacterium]|nr:TonB C-terminal domain-containing protein [Deltaproteobacteria bacterium]MBW2150608.1 TonB C-terminal domain-containing protein [Deltaproteobacteria bacterium]